MREPVRFVPKRVKQGFTLLEVIVAVAILGLLVSLFLSAFYSGAAGILFSGQKSRELLELQSIVDDLNSRSFADRAEIDTYLGTTKGYRSVADMSSLSTMVSGQYVNYYLSAIETKAGVNGYSVSFVRFISSGKRSARISTFIITRGT